MRHAVFVLALLVSCTEDQPCDVGYRLENRICKPLPIVDASSSGDVMETPFGRVCRSDDDCASPAPTCFKQPTDATGFCSVTGCDANPALCPSGWTCFDLSVLQPGAPHGCVKF